MCIVGSVALFSFLDILLSMGLFYFFFVQCIFETLFFKDIYLKWCSNL